MPTLQKFNIALVTKIYVALGVLFRCSSVVKSNADILFCV